MKVNQLIRLLGTDERGRAVRDIASHQSPSFVLSSLSRYMTEKPGHDDEWGEFAVRIRELAFEMEGRGL